MSYINNKLRQHYFSPGENTIDCYYALFHKTFPKYIFYASDNKNYDPTLLLEFLTKNYVCLFKTTHDSIVKRIFESEFPYDENDSSLILIDGLESDPNSLWIKVGYDNTKIYFSCCCNDESKIKTLFEETNKFAKKIKQNINILCCTRGHFSLKKCPLKEIKINITENYGASFENVHKKIMDKLALEESGLYLFHGCPGTGKSSYLKYLTHEVKREFIFINTSQINLLASPDFSNFLLDNRNSVLILEDAEKAVISRSSGEGNESLVSILLNLSDGILGTLLNISIILTFNTGKENIDPALLRKGRLIVEHEFKALKIDEAQIMVDKLKKKHKVEKEMTLAEIYNLEEDNFHKEKKEDIVLGFAIK